jgi:hypothetical protein
MQNLIYVRSTKNFLPVSWKYPSADQSAARPGLEKFVDRAQESIGQRNNLVLGGDTFGG